MTDELIDTLGLAIGYIGSSDRADRMEHVARIRALLSASRPAVPEVAAWRRPNGDLYQENPSGFSDWTPLYEHPAAPAQSGEWDTYRLKVAEDCNERLMSACSDTGCPDGVNMADWIRGLGMLAPSRVAPAPSGEAAVKRLPSREEIQNLRDHGHGEEAAYWEEALRKAAPQPSQPAPQHDLWELIREINGGGAGRVVPAPAAPSAVVLDDERAAFEAWWLRDVPEGHRAFAKKLLDGYGQDYVAAPGVADAWTAWQARAASPQPALSARQGDIDALFARVTEWVTANCIPFEKQNELFRILAASPQPVAQTERALNIGPAMTPFGMLVRALRIVAGTTLYDMAKHLSCTSAMLSAVEFGRQPVTDAMVADASAYFSGRGIPDTLHALKAAAQPASGSHNG
jgi:hypothetical protein